MARSQVPGSGVAWGSPSSASPQQRGGCPTRCLPTRCLRRLRAPFRGCCRRRDGPANASTGLTCARSDDTAAHERPAWTVIGQRPRSGASSPHARLCPRCRAQANGQRRRVLCARTRRLPTSLVQEGVPSRDPGRPRLMWVSHRLPSQRVPPWAPRRANPTRCFSCECPTEAPAGRGRGGRLRWVSHGVAVGVPRGATGWRHAGVAGRRSPPRAVRRLP